MRHIKELILELPASGNKDHFRACMNTRLIAVTDDGEKIFVPYAGADIKIRVDDVFTVRIDFENVVIKDDDLICTPN